MIIGDTRTPAAVKASSHCCHTPIFTHLSEPQALLVGDVELVIHCGGVLAGGAPWLQVELVAHLLEHDARLLCLVELGQLDHNASA